MIERDCLARAARRGSSLEVIVCTPPKPVPAQLIRSERSLLDTTEHAHNSVHKGG
jgi:hypothetical protein